MFGFGHHHNQPAPPASGPNQIFKIFCRANKSYCLTVRDGNVVLAPVNPKDEHQMQCVEHWYKDMRFSTKVKDEEGMPAFALVNKATGLAIKHPLGQSHPVKLVPFSPEYEDASVLWTESKDVGKSFRCIRMVNNTRLNFDAFHGDKDHGGVQDGTTVVLWEWCKGENKSWQILPWGPEEHAPAAGAGTACTMRIVVLILAFMPFAAADRPDPLGEICGTTSGNYTANCTYQANLEHLSTILPKNTSSAPTLFVKDSLGAAPDIVYGLALCRGDANPSACYDCVGFAFQDAQQLCAYNKDVTIFYDPCILSFANWNFFDLANSSTENFQILSLMNTQNMPMLPGWDPSDAESATIITAIITLLAKETAKLAAYNSTRMYATGRMVITSTFPTLFSMAQCTPDLLPPDCWDCLQNITAMTTKKFSGRRGGRILSLRCNFRYEMYPFYQGQPMLQIESSATVVPVTNSTTNTATPPPPPRPPPVAVPIQKHKRRMSKVLVIATAVPLLASFFFFIFCFGLIRRYRKGKVSLQDKPNMNVHEDEELVWEIEARSSEFTFFDFSQLSDATSNFSDENKLGQGGFGPVYKGQFPDGLEIAIKRLASHSGQGFTEFKNEVQLIAKLQHTNLIRLLGCCSQGEEKILIYEYLSNKSLDFFIFDETRRALLNWNKRLAIIEGIAQGLLYLHKHSRLRVIHRDLKASNILLDGEMNPKISDFGLAKIVSSNDTDGNTERVVGTYGYMSPEYASEGIFSIKSDVFSFGVLILEIISGKRNSGFHQNGNFFNLLGYAWKMWKVERWLEFVDASLISEFHALETMRCINMALLCVQENAVDRPTMSDVVAMLSSESMALPEPKHPAYFHVRVTKEEAATVTEPSSVNSY